MASQPTTIMAYENHWFPLIMNRAGDQTLDAFMHQRPSGSLEQVRNFKPFRSESETLQKHRSQRVPFTRLVIVNCLGLVFDKDLWKKNNGKNKGISFVERISKKQICRFQCGYESV